MAWRPTCRSNRAWPAPRTRPAAKPRRRKRPAPGTDSTPAAGPCPLPEPSMFGYYFHLALRSFRRNRVLTALMVLAIALGIGTCMTTLTVFRVLSGDPIPGKSGQLYYVQLDPEGMQGYTPGSEPNEQVTRTDAETLLREKRGDRQAMMTGGGVSVTPDRADLTPFVSDARYASTDFFPMFQVPFLHGNGWSQQDDESRARVVVISSDLNDRVFGGSDSVG